MTAESIRAQFEDVDAQIRAKRHRNVQDLIDLRAKLRQDAQRAEHRFYSHGLIHTLTVEPEGDGWAVEIVSFEQEPRITITRDEGAALAAALAAGTAFVVDTAPRGHVSFVAARDAWDVRLDTSDGSRSVLMSFREAAELADLIRGRV